jgi:amino acid transporter
VREATGLVREVSAKSSFVAQWMLVTGGYPIFILTYLGIFPGANFFLAFVLGFIPMFALLAVYTLFAMSMPRAGGDYIYISRGLEPTIGFIISFSLAATYLVSDGIFTVLGTSYLGYHLTALGIVHNNAALLALGSAIITPWYTFSVATIILAFSAVVAILRPKIAWESIFWAGLISIVLTAVMFAALATIGQGTFQAAYDQFIASNNSTLVSNGFTNATTYQQTISAGGWSPQHDVFIATLAAYPIALYTFAFSQLPANWAGEIKQARKNMPIILLGGMIGLLVTFVLLVQLSMNAFGQPFLTSWSVLSTNPSYPLMTTLSDYIPFFSYLVYPNDALMWIMFLALFIPVIFEMPPLMIASVRYLFAWSFDRVLPAKLASVNERTHTPVVATIVAFIVTMFGAVIQSFYPASSPSVLVPVVIFAYLFPALAAIVLPYSRKQLYETSFVVKKRIASIPVITWLGIISFVGLAIGLYGTMASGLYPLLLPDYVFYAVIYSLPIIIFVTAYFVRKQSGLGLMLAFKEIPPE